MDEFLKSNTSFIRMLGEYKKHKNLVIGFDFDGTVHDYHNKGETYFQVIKLLQDLDEMNCIIYCWTAYEDHEYVKDYCRLNKIPCYGVNVDDIPLQWQTRKPFYNYILDDRSGLTQQFNELSLLVYLVKNNLLNLN